MSYAVLFIVVVVIMVVAMVFNSVLLFVYLFVSLCFYCYCFLFFFFWDIPQLIEGVRFSGLFMALVDLWKLKLKLQETKAIEMDLPW